MKTIHALVISTAMALLVAAGAGMAEEPVIKKHSVYELKVMDANGELVEVRLDSDELGFDALDLAEGDSHTFNLQDGRPITISNVEGEIWMDVDGELFELSALHGRHGMKAIGMGDHMAYAYAIAGHHEGLTIRSAEPLERPQGGGP